MTLFHKSYEIHKSHEYLAIVQCCRINLLCHPWSWANVAGLWPLETVDDGRLTGVRETCCIIINIIWLSCQWWINQSKIDQPALIRRCWANYYHEYRTIVAIQVALEPLHIVTIVLVLHALTELTDLCYSSMISSHHHRWYKSFTTQPTHPQCRWWLKSWCPCFCSSCWAGWGACLIPDRCSSSWCCRCPTGQRLWLCPEGSYEYSTVVFCD